MPKRVFKRWLDFVTSTLGIIFDVVTAVAIAALAFNPEIGDSLLNLKWDGVPRWWATIPLIVWINVGVVCALWGEASHWEQQHTELVKRIKKIEDTRPNLVYDGESPLVGTYETASGVLRTASWVRAHFTNVYTSELTVITAKNLGARIAIHDATGKQVQFVGNARWAEVGRDGGRARSLAEMWAFELPVGRGCTLDLVSRDEESSLIKTWSNDGQGPTLVPSQYFLDVALNADSMPEQHEYFALLVPESPKAPMQLTHLSARPECLE